MMKLKAFVTDWTALCGETQGPPPMDVKEPSSYQRSNAIDAVTIKVNNKR
jgi:hypothetical protein